MKMINKQTTVATSDVKSVMRTLKQVSPPLFWLPSCVSFLSQNLPEVNVKVLCVLVDKAGKWLSQSESVLMNSSDPWVVFNSVLTTPHFPLLLWYILCSPYQKLWWLYLWWEESIYSFKFSSSEISPGL